LLAVWVRTNVSPVDLSMSVPANTIAGVYTSAANRHPQRRPLTRTNRTQPQGLRALGFFFAHFSAWKRNPTAEGLLSVATTGSAWLHPKPPRGAVPATTGSAGASFDRRNTATTTSWRRLLIGNRSPRSLWLRNPGRRDRHRRCGMRLAAVVAIALSGVPSAHSLVGMGRPGCASSVRRRSARDGW